MFGDLIEMAIKVGFFGKLPGYGDFIQRNVSPNFINQWDNWILQSIEASHMQLGDAWKEVYFNSPIWRFTIDGTIFKGDTITGIIMPSVDSAGRSYPFSVICQSPSLVNPFIVAEQVDDLHENCEEFILSLLEKKRPDLDEICKVLQQTYAQLDLAACEDIGHHETSSTAELCRVKGLNLPPLPASNLSFLSTMLQRHNIQISIWNTAETMHFDAQRRYYKGLPPVDMFTSLLLGE
jgi:type VI secretion system protein ImpM